MKPFVIDEQKSFLLPMEEIIENEEYWPRISRDEERVQEFTALYTDEGLTALPSLVVTQEDKDGNRFLVDGWHRIEAAERAGFDEVRVVEFFAKSKSAIRIAAIQFSAVGSKPLTWEEKRRAADYILQHCPELSDREIARCAGVSQPFVSGRRKTMQDSSVPATDNVIRDTAEDGDGEEDRAAERPSSPASNMTAQQAALTLMRAVQKVEQSGLFWFRKDSNMAKVLAEAAIQIHGDEALKVLANLAKWYGGAEEYCVRSMNAK